MYDDSGKSVKSKAYEKINRAAMKKTSFTNPTVKEYEKVRGATSRDYANLLRQTLLQNAA